MDLMWMLMLLVLVSSEAENITEVRGPLGQNITLTCSFNVTDIFWFMEIHNQLRAGIGRTFSSSPSFYSPDFKSKYLLEENRLVIKNVSSDDSRLYLCGRKSDGAMVYGDAIRLVSDQPVTPPDDTKTNEEEDQMTNPVWTVLLTLNVVLLFLLGLTCAFMKRKSCCCRGNGPPESINQNPQNDDIQLHNSQSPECVYSKIHFPDSPRPRC